MAMNAAMCAEEKPRGEVDDADDGVDISTLEVQNTYEGRVKKDEIYGDFLDEFKVNGKAVRSLYDTGVTMAVICNS